MGSHPTSNLFKVSKTSTINDFENIMADDMTRKDLEKLVDIFFNEDADKNNQSGGSVFINILSN